MLVFIKVKVASADALVAQDAVGRSELGHDQPASAQVFDEAAEDGIGDSGHGSQHGGGSDADVADLEACRKDLSRCGDKSCGDGRFARPIHRCIRIVPELSHRLYSTSFPSPQPPAQPRSPALFCSLSGCWLETTSFPGTSLNLAANEKPHRGEGVDIREIRVDPRKLRLLLRRFGFRGFGFARIALGILAAETLYAPGGIHELLLARKEGM